MKNAEQVLFFARSHDHPLAWERLLLSAPHTSLHATGARNLRSGCTDVMKVLRCKGCMHAPDHYLVEHGSVAAQCCVRASSYKCCMKAFTSGLLLPALQRHVLLQTAQEALSAQQGMVLHAHGWHTVSCGSSCHLGNVHSISS